MKKPMKIPPKKGGGKMACKLIFQNLRRNLRDYAVYFFTLMIAISLFYAFNSLQDAKALQGLDPEMLVMLKQLGSLIRGCSIVIAGMIGFLILYVNRFLLKRRKKELGIYMLLGMKKRKISGIFVGETFLVGLGSLAAGTGAGIFFAQILTVAALRAFGGYVDAFTMSFSMQALKMTAACFGVIYLLVMVLNVWEISAVKLIDLLLAERKNETVRRRDNVVYVVIFCAAAVCLAAAGICLNADQSNLIPGKENLAAGGTFVVVGTLLLFYSAAAVVLKVLQRRKQFYFRDVNSFLVRQIGSRIQGNYLSMSAVCILLTVTMILITTGSSIAMTMTGMSKDFSPYDFAVYMMADGEENVENGQEDMEENGGGDVDVLAEAAKEYSDIRPFVESSFQIRTRTAKYTYGDLFAGQKVELWAHDKSMRLLDKQVDIISVSDYNQCLEAQGCVAVTLGAEEYLLNCNYKGTFAYVEQVLKEEKEIRLGGVALRPASEEVLSYTYIMTSIGDNDRGTLIVPDEVAAELVPDDSIVVQGSFKADADIGVIHQMLTDLVFHAGDFRESAFAWNTKARMNTMFYSAFGMPVFLCLYIGLIFLLICTALISVQQLTGIADNRMRYRILEKQGVPEEMMRRTVRKQVAVYFMAPLVLSLVYTAVSLRAVMQRVSDFMNMEIGANVWVTCGVLLMVYGGYYMLTACSCEKMIIQRKR